VLFDKTGTLTHGRPEIVATKVRSGGEADLNTLLSLAASVADPSGHPLSQAVARLTSDRLELADWKERQGAGVEAVRQTVSGAVEPIRLGSLRWLHECGVQVTEMEGWLEDRTAEGATVLGLARANRLALLLVLRDTLKPHAGEVVRQLQKQGLAVHLVTGDHPRTAAAIAHQAGIPADCVHAHTRPEEKLALVRKLQEQGASVAFVGDGINDAPALEQANLGIAVRRASDIATEAADIVLLRSDIEAVPESLALARATLRTIKQNLFWAFFYNALGIPLAALGFMSPVLCALAMGASDIVVIGNALRLLRR
jgi:Cu+-exporting ATPase